MERKIRMVDINVCPCKDCMKDSAGCFARVCPEFAAWITSAVEAVPVRDIKLHHIEIVQHKFSYDPINTKVYCSVRFKRNEEDLGATFVTTLGELMEREFLSMEETE